MSSPSLAMAVSLTLRPPHLPNPNHRSLVPASLKPIPSPALSAHRLPPLNFSTSRPLLWFSSPRRLGLLARADEKGRGEATKSASSDEDKDATGQSTMPEQFRYLTKEAPDRPVRWPWFIVLGFLVYAWRTVLWELTNWKKAAVSILGFFGYLSKLALAILFHYFGNQITGIIRCIEFSLYYARYIYGSIVAFAPVPELTRIIFFSSTVLAIAEATVPNAVSKQPYLLTLAGIAGFGAVKGFVPELLFWILITGLFCYSRFIKKRDGISAALPAVAVLAAVGEPWVRALVIGSYLALAIAQYSETSKGSVGKEGTLSGRRTPAPLLVVALALGVRLAMKWVRHRHLTWMIA